MRNEQTLRQDEAVMTFKANDQVDGLFSGSVSDTGVVRLILWLAVLSGVVLLGAVGIWPEQALVFNQEGGLFETISAACLFAAGVAALWRYPGVTRLYIGLTFLLLAERELEAGVYPEGSLPFLILDGLDVVLDVTLVRVVLACVVLGGVIWHGIPTGWCAVKQRASFLIVFIAAGCLAVIAQLLEEFTGLHGQALSSVVKTRLFVMEETLEMFFSIGILASVLIGWSKSNSDETSHDKDIRAFPDPS